MTARIELSGGLVALVDDADLAHVTQSGKWSAKRGRKTFYAVRKLAGRKVALHTFLTGWPLVDHINGNGLDNRRANLREARHVENQRNRGRNRNNTSGYKGVHLLKQTGRWQAGIVVDRRRKHLGYHDTAEGAARAYDRAALEHFGPFAHLNFPEEVGP